MEKQPFTPEEEDVMALLAAAHNKFIKLPIIHPSDHAEWILSFHRLQYLMMSRILARDYSEYFYHKK